MVNSKTVTTIIEGLTMEQKEGFFAAIKLTSVWAAVGISSWSDFAAFIASIYSCILVIEWIWKIVKAYRAGKSTDEGSHG